MESNRIEYKRELTDGFEREAVAFLNYRDGGVLYLGIGQDGSVVGVPNCDAVQLAIKDRLKNNILPSCLGLFDVIHEIRKGQDLVRVTFASGPEKPYYLRKYGMSEKGYFVRIGSATEPMSGRMIEELFARRTRNSIGLIRSPRQTLSFEQLKSTTRRQDFRWANSLRRISNCSPKTVLTTTLPICWPTEMAIRCRLPNIAVWIAMI
jgi:ATP-dependent DNA helicase RecG